METCAHVSCALTCAAFQTGGIFRLYPINVMRLVFDLKVKQKILHCKTLGRTILVRKFCLEFIGFSYLY